MTTILILIYLLKKIWVKASAAMIYAGEQTIIVLAAWELIAVVVVGYANLNSLQCFDLVNV